MILQTKAALIFLLFIGEFAINVSSAVTLAMRIRYEDALDSKKPATCGRKMKLILNVTPGGQTMGGNIEWEVSLRVNSKVPGPAVVFDWTDCNTGFSGNVKGCRPKPGDPPTGIIRSQRTTYQWRSTEFVVIVGAVKVQAWQPLFSMKAAKANHHMPPS
eukprot:Platyproteum_vivax@DN6473_c0_g1_i2.p1